MAARRRETHDWTNSRLRNVFRRFDFDAETGHADICTVRGHQQPDAGNTKILQYLRAKADLAPLPGARILRAVILRRYRGAGHAGRAVLQVDDDTFALFVDLGHGPAHYLGAAKDVADHVP